jgi:hypothetical protein
MNTTTRKPGIAHRIGRAIRQSLNKLNAFELGVARRAGKAYPSIGFTVVRGTFLTLKLAIVVALLFISIWLVLCVLMILVPAAVIANSKRLDDEVPGYGNLGHPLHKQFYPGHSHYLED